jgi:hypothetical protein
LNVEIDFISQWVCSSILGEPIPGDPIPAERTSGSRFIQR